MNLRAIPSSAMNLPTLLMDKDAKVVSLSQTDELMVAEALSRDLIDQKSSKEDETLKKNKTSAQVEPQVDPQVDPQATEPAVETCTGSSC